MITGAENRVLIRVASISAFLLMKVDALAGRDKPKDVYDICYCLDHGPDTMETVAKSWRDLRGRKLVAKRTSWSGGS